MNLGVPELLILMVIVLLLFGPGRLGNIAGEMGKGIRSFREGLKGDDNQPKKPDETEISEKSNGPEEETKEAGESIDSKEQEIDETDKK